MYNRDLIYLSQLAAAGPVGVAAAAAIVSAKKRRRRHSFEINPSVRERQRNRLLRKLHQIIDEFATLVGQQAVVLVATPGKPNTSYKVFGAKPLQDVVKNLRSIVMEELESALAQQAPSPVQDDPSLFELPPLIIDGIPTPVEKMTEAQLRAFIPLMLKYSTGRGKPGWGRDSTRPPWWPKELPWANVRTDARSDEEKQKISWTHALRQIVINCYKYHGREDLLPAFTEDDKKVNGSGRTTNSNMTTQFAPAVLYTITNPDDTVSIVQVDSNNPIITLPDGTTAHFLGLATIQTSQGDGSVHTVQTTAEVCGQGEVVDLHSITEATLSQDGQIILTSEDGHGYRGKSETNLKQHIRNRHSDNLDTRQVPCPICKKLYASKNSLFYHIKSHNPSDMRYKCLICTKSYYNKSNFNVHMRRHTGERPHKCEHCDKAFASISDYRRHVRTHTGERPFQCKFCEKKFRESSALLHHTRLHTGERPYKCEQCSQTFNRSGNYKRHLKVHRDRTAGKIN